MEQQIDFFVSYSNEDENEVQAIVASLESEGAKCWYASRDATGRYAKSIVSAIGNAKIMLLCLSKSAATSDHVLNEVEMAYNKKRTSSSNLMIQPLCLQPLDLDSPEFDEIMYYIRRINFIMSEKSHSAAEIAHEIIVKNQEYLGIQLNKPKKKPRSQSAYYTSERETVRLRQQTMLLRKFDNDVYQRAFSSYRSPVVLDVGCGNGDFIFDRLADYADHVRIIGVEKSEEKVEEAKKKYGNERVSFIVSDVESAGFTEELMQKMDEMDIEQFDIINISMLLLHLKSASKLLRKLRRMLQPEGIVIIKDIDDGLNYAYPDDDGSFERVYRICDMNETSGERKNGRQIYTSLNHAGFKRITLEKQGFTSIGMTVEEKEAFWGIYFQFILGDIKWMHDKYPDNRQIEEDCIWYTENYDRMLEAFMRDDFVFSLGLQIYTAKK